MSEDRALILQMLADGKIDAEEAERLLQQIEEGNHLEKKGYIAKFQELGKSIGDFTESIGRKGKDSETKEGSDDSLKKAAYAMDDVQKKIDTDELIHIVKSHARSTSVAAAGSAWVTGAGATIATTLSAGFVWSMIYRINEQIGIKLKKDEVKKIGKSILNSIVPMAATSYLASTGLSFIPVLGNLASCLIMTSVCYSAVFTSGVVYMKAARQMLKEKEDGQTLQADEMERKAESVIKSEDISQIFKEAQDSYKEAKDDTAEETVELVSDEEEQE